MRFKTLMIAAVALGATTLVTSNAYAHRAWLKPSATVLSGDEAVVTVDAAISNTLFHPDHYPMSTDGIVVIGPEGNEIALQNAAKGRYRSTFDVELAQQGTYKIVTASGGLRAFWKDADGNRKMWPGRGEQADEAEFSSAVPKDADDLTVSRGWRRIETFVTVGMPTETALKPTNQGLELVPQTHPNDLYATETATFQLLIDGAPAEGADVEVIPGGMRYRNSQDEMTFTTDANGMIEVTWPQAGMYFMEVQYRDDQAQAPATVRTGSYSATFEVLPL